MPLNKVMLYLDGVTRLRNYRRKETFTDTCNAIGIALSGKGFKEYVEKIGESNG